MTVNEVKAKLTELESDQDFMKTLAQCESVEELAKVFSDKGIIVSEEELEKALQTTSVSTGDDELDESALENVSGGILGLLVAGWIAVNVGVFGGALALSKAWPKSKKK